MSTAAHPTPPTSPSVSVIRVTRGGSPRLVHSFLWEGLTGIYLLPARVPMLSGASRHKALTQSTWQLPLRSSGELHDGRAQNSVGK
jgi:hypothetical protein